MITHTSQLDTGDPFFTDRFSFNRLVRVEMYPASFRILRICIEKVAGLDDVNCQSQRCLHDIVKALFQQGNFEALTLYSSVNNKTGGHAAYFEVITSGSKFS